MFSQIKAATRMTNWDAQTIIPSFDFLCCHHYQLGIWMKNQLRNFDPFKNRKTNSIIRKSLEEYRTLASSYTTLLLKSQKGQKTDTKVQFPATSSTLVEKSHLLTELVLPCSRQIPCGAHDQHLCQFCSLCLSSSLLDCVPACSINPSLQDTWNSWTFETNKPVTSMATIGNIFLLESPCARHIGGESSWVLDTQVWSKHQGFFSFLNTAVPADGFFPNRTRRHAIAFLQALVKSFTAMN